MWKMGGSVVVVVEGLDAEMGQHLTMVRRERWSLCRVGLLWSSSSCSRDVGRTHEGKPVQDILRQENQNPVYPLPQDIPVSRQHELEQLRRALEELVDLRESGGVEDGEAGVDGPFVGVDAELDVNLDRFEAADVVAVLLGVAEGVSPHCAHAGWNGGLVE